MDLKWDEDSVDYEEQFDEPEFDEEPCLSLINKLQGRKRRQQQQCREVASSSNGQFMFLNEELDPTEFTIRSLRAAGIHYVEGIDMESIKRDAERRYNGVPLIPGTVPIFMDDTYFKAYPALSEKSSSEASISSGGTGNSINVGRNNRSSNNRVRVQLCKIVTPKSYQEAKKQSANYQEAVRRPVAKYVTPRQLYNLKKRQQQQKPSIIPK